MPEPWSNGWATLHQGTVTITRDTERAPLTVLAVQVY